MGMCNTTSQISQRIHLRRGAAETASGAFFCVSDGEADTRVIVCRSLIGVFSWVLAFLPRGRVPQAPSPFRSPEMATVMPNKGAR
jgi:hypothetical protein